MVWNLKVHPEWQSSFNKAKYFTPSKKQTNKQTKLHQPTCDQIFKYKSYVSYSHSNHHIQLPGPHIPDQIRMQNVLQLQNSKRSFTIPTKFNSLTLSWQKKNIVFLISFQFKANYTFPTWNGTGCPLTFKKNLQRACW